MKGKNTKNMVLKKNEFDKNFIKKFKYYLQNRNLTRILKNNNNFRIFLLQLLKS